MSQAINQIKDNSVVIEEVEDNELVAVCGFSCQECQFYEDKCMGCRLEKGIMFWGRCPIYFCCVYGKGLQFCAECSQFLCQRFLDQITTSIGL